MRPDFEDAGDGEKRAEGERNGCPGAVLPARQADGDEDECRGGGEEDSQDKRLNGWDDAEPCTEHGHEFGIAEAHALFAADEPVGEADDEDDGGGGEDGEELAVEPGEPGDGLSGGGGGPVAEEIEEEAEGYAGEGECVGEPEVLEVEGGEGDEEPGKECVAEECGGEPEDLAVGGEIAREVGGGGVVAGGEDGLAVLEPKEGEDEADECFNGGIEPGDAGVALAAAATEEEEAEEGDVFPPGEGVGAGAAVGGGESEVFGVGPAGAENVEEAAEGESEAGGKEGGRGEGGCGEGGSGLGGEEHG